MRPRCQRTRTTEAAPDDQIRADELTRVFAVPDWLRDLGLTAWLLLGVTLLLVGVMFLLSLTDAIVMPVVTATIAAAVLSPTPATPGRPSLGSPRSTANSA